MAHIQLIGLSEQKSPDNKIWKFPYAFPIIIRELQKTRHTFDVMDTHLHKKTYREMAEFLDNQEAAIYGISAWSHHYRLVKEMSQIIRKKHKEAVIITGGILAANDDVLMKNTEVDIAATGAEGEFILPEILDALDNDRDSLRAIKGITFKDIKRNRIIKTEKREVMNADEFQLQERPAYEYFHDELLELAHNINSKEDYPVKGFPLLTGRGCPFQCTFCGSIYGRRFLKKSWKSFFDEIEFLVERYGVKGFFSYDTNMFLNENDVEGFCAEYKKRNSSFTMCSELRPSFGDYDMFKKLGDHGVRVLLFGFESGSQHLLDRMKRGISVNTMEKVIKSAMDAGLIIHGNFVFGTPGENFKTIKETKKTMLSLEKWIDEQKVKFQKMNKKNTSGYGWASLIPSPTSELYTSAIKNNLISDEEEYLLSLGVNNVTELIEGSSSKIRLVHIGGDVNMSEFTSKNALLAYIKLSIAIIKLQSCLSRRYRKTQAIVDLFICIGKVMLNAVKFSSIVCFDVLRGKKGFVKPDDTSHEK